jgi:hypothetical protein
MYNIHVLTIYSKCTNVYGKKIFLDWLGLWCLTPLSTIFQLYHSGQFYQGKPPTCRKSLTSLSLHKVVSSTHRHIIQSQLIYGQYMYIVHAIFKFLRVHKM